MRYDSDNTPPTLHRWNPWLKWGIAAAAIAAGIWLFNNWDYGPLNNFRGNWNMARGGYGGHMMGYGFGFGSGYGMGIGMLLFWGLIIYAVVSLISGSFPKKQNPGQTAGQADDALQILKKRYARGEIDKTKFDAMRRDLSV